MPSNQEKLINQRYMKITFDSLKVGGVWIYPDVMGVYTKSDKNTDGLEYIMECSDDDYHKIRPIVTKPFMNYFRIIA